MGTIMPSLFEYFALLARVEVVVPRSTSLGVGGTVDRKYVSPWLLSPAARASRESVLHPLGIKPFL